ncbi:LodA/GoxA family CTQ-dependent oxidase [Saccharothrix sp. ST-888]|uniref:LodA/GoxA family CTQ-dependent oxidase n=1 Tax=Saccharothrix sp. ST-888 TaxID=1427391 RepID=UPI0005ECF8AB|nr:LodA/GoxA family CTQ-dependent oxidase [Saccharothrix sp. ST-888]KJK60039.1 hypothetical protein UK12_00980 [Saccharothrix sp. ST-888]
MTELALKDIHHVRIHPAIGFARVGNSTSSQGHFIGPEIPGVFAGPERKEYKDEDGRVKRQAARFRCFGYNEAGDRWVELKVGTDVKIDWTVHLVNKKACSQESPIGLGDGWRNRKDRKKPPTPEERRKLTIDPGPVTVSGPSKSTPPAYDQIILDGMAVPVVLGELRTDADGHVLVLGGSGAAGSPKNCPVDDPFNNNGWWDDTSDGSVDALVHLAGRQQPLKAERAWAVVTPPKYAPELDTVVTLWDRLTDFFASSEEIESHIPSYTLDIQPIFHRARMIQAVHMGAAGMHIGWPEPMYEYYLRRKIHSWLRRGPEYDPKLMPRMSTLSIDDGRLTERQLHFLDKWRDGNFIRDWNPAGSPPKPGITPEGLDRAALEACVGKSFCPGIEAGRFFLEPANWATPQRHFRFAKKVEPGDVTGRMALPWQADFRACATEWWPVPRPNQVIPQGDDRYLDWHRFWAEDLLGMAENWSKLGFVLSDAQGNHREVGRVTEDWVLRLTPGGPFPRPLPPGQWTSLSAEGPDSAVWQAPEQLTGVDLACYGRGELPPGEEHSWPLMLTDEDRSLEITVRCADPKALSVRFATPIGPEVAEDDTHRTGVIGSDAQVLRLDLPVEVMPDRFAHDGLWALRISAPGAAAAVAYQLTVATESGVRIGEAAVRRAPGGALTVTTELGDRRVHRVEVLAADGSAVRLEPTTGSAAGRFAVADPAGLGAAESTVRLRVAGASALGHPFVRERFLTVGR